MKTSKLKTVVCIILAFVTVCVYTAAAAEKEKIPRMCMLRGPTVISLTKFAVDNGSGMDFALCASPQEAVAAMLSGGAEFAMLPTNLAATLYRKTNGAFQMLCVNTLGVLHVLERGNSVNGVGDLAGKTLYASSPGSAAQYALEYVLKSNGLEDKVKTVYVADHTELALRAAAHEADLLVLPEPYAQMLINKAPEFRRALDMTTLFEDAARARGSGARLAMGCVAVNKAYAEEHPEKVSDFLTRYRESVDYANGHPQETAERFNEDMGLREMPITGDMLAGCHMVCITGEEMKNTAQPFFRILLEADPKSIGGSLPGDDFYYPDVPAGARDGDKAA